MKKYRNVVTMAFVLMTQSAAACVASDPLTTAEWIYTNERDFAFQTEGRELSARKRFLSPRLYDLLAANWKCEDIEAGMCALSSDPWTNAQDGGELPPIKFKLHSENAAGATVRMSFQFGWPDSPGEPAEVLLKFVKEPKFIVLVTG